MDVTFLYHSDIHTARSWTAYLSKSVSTAITVDTSASTSTTTSPVPTRPCRDCFCSTSPARTFHLSASLSLGNGGLCHIHVSQRQKKKDYMRLCKGRFIACNLLLSAHAKLVTCDAVAQQKRYACHKSRKPMLYPTKNACVLVGEIISFSCHNQVHSKGGSCKRCTFSDFELPGAAAPKSARYTPA